jgi:hypothetical protein
MTAITRKRGDTYGETITVTDSTGTAIDITGYSFVLTVDPEKAPATAANNMFSITGTILSAVSGTVEFAPSALQADQTPGTYYYDVQLVDGAGRIRTIALDKWVVTQDISK